MQAVNDTDFEIEVKFESSVDEQFQLQGLLVEEGPGDFLRFDFYSDGNVTKVFAAIFTGGAPTIESNSSTSLAGFPLFMRVSRTGDQWTQQYSSDGVNWTTNVTFSFPMTVSTVGVFAGNHGSPVSASPAHTAVVDYFFNTASPISPEDGGGSGLPEYMLDATASGMGTVTIDPEQVTYTSGQTVTLTAVPDAGYQFDGWSGDISGSTNPVSVTMDADYNIIANFGEDNAPPVISNISITNGTNAATVTWSTNEFTIGRVEYGETVAYEMGFVENAIYQTNHSIQLNGLTNGVIYHYRVVSVDQAGFVTASPDATFILSEGAVINVWYGLNQTFGQIGVPHQWVNILGNVSDTDGISQLTFTINGGVSQNLPIGPSRRLENLGDFNIEIDFSDLSEGDNQINISAIDSIGNLSVKSVTVNYSAGNVWPLNYNIDWSTAGSIESVAQIVDGLWEIDNTING
jgi:uncharacterized repeat protein (TIGR02543 family)